MSKGTEKKLDISVKGKDEIERLLLILNIGFMTAIEEDVMEAEETEFRLYSPYSIETLEKKGVNREIIDLIHKGLFIGDEKRLCSDASAYLKTVSEIKKEALRLLNMLPKDNKYNHWLV